MLDKERNRKILIIITSVLLLVLVIVGIIMLFSHGEKKNDKKGGKDTVDYRCVGDLCISKVQVEENEGQKSIYLALKNEGTTVIEKQCVKLTSKENSFNFCANNLEAGNELGLAFEYLDSYGTKIEDYKLEEGVEEGTTTETAPEESATPEVTG